MEFCVCIGFLFVVIVVRRAGQDSHGSHSPSSTSTNPIQSPLTRHDKLVNEPITPIFNYAKTPHSRIWTSPTQPITPIFNYARTPQTCMNTVAHSQSRLFWIMRGRRSLACWRVQCTNLAWRSRLRPVGWTNGHCLDDGWAEAFFPQLHELDRLSRFPFRKVYSRQPAKAVADCEVTTACV